MSIHAELMAFQRETEALSLIAGMLGWDRETMMPRGAVAQRAEEMAAIEAVLHARRTDPRLGEWLTGIDDGALDQVGRANLRHIRRNHARNTRVPADLAAAIARETSLAQGIWADARANEDFAAFAPAMEKVLHLRQQEADAISNGGDRYDALLQDHEPTMTAAGISAMFDALRPRLVALRDRVMGSSVAPEPLRGRFDEAGQMRMARRLAEVFGYDFGRGRLDKAVHPFSSGSGPDARITTRTAEDDPFNCFYSTIHEVGHACYEQGIDDAYLLTPLGQGVSMGVHESQSRIYENQIGRSRAFAGWLHGRMVDEFGDMGTADANGFYGTVNRVAQGFIRTEADELQYNLHIMLRFDLERALVSGELGVPDLPDAWNERFNADFGFRVDRPSNGCMQDVHWPVGMFGYFPSYTLGNVYAGCLHRAMRNAVPDLDEALSRGNTGPATMWLRENLQVHGGLHEPAEVVRRACGFEPSEGPLLNYLEEKFSEIYCL